MLKLVAILLSFTAFLAHADFPALEFKNLNVIVDNPSPGIISGEFARYAAGPVWLKHSNFKFNFHQKPNKLIIEDGISAVSLKHQLPFLNSFEKLHLHDAQVNSTAGLFTLDFTRLELINENTFFDVQETIASCNGKSTMGNVGVFDTVIYSCLNRSVLSIDQLDFKNDKLTEIFNALQRINPKSGKNPFKIEQVKDISLSVAEEKVHIEATIKPVIKIKLKIDGTVNYNAKKNILALKIEKAKWGFISIKNILFKILKKINIEEVRVEKPYLYIDISNNNERRL